MGEGVEDGIFFKEIGEGVYLDFGVVYEGHVTEQAWG